MFLETSESNCPKDLMGGALETPCGTVPPHRYANWTLTSGSDHTDGIYAWAIGVVVLSACREC